MRELTADDLALLRIAAQGLAPVSRAAITETLRAGYVRTLGGVEGERERP